MTDSLYHYWPITHRPPIEWPEGKRLAFYVALNIEHFELGKPSTSLFPGTAGLKIDPLNHGWREYGTRVGIWRMIECLDRHDLRASVLLNADVCSEYPAIVDAGVERDWAWLGHGRNNSSLWTDFDPDAERDALQTIIREITAATGRPPKGWLGPALVETANTPALLAELGFTYLMDWCNDDQPYPLNVGSVPFISVPYTAEVNDIPLFLVSGLTGPDFLQLVVDQFDVLYEESKRRSGGVMAVCLHPFLVNQPFRHKYIDQALAYVRSHDDVWFTTSDDIADWYLTHCYAEARQALDAFVGESSRA